MSRPDTPLPGQPVAGRAPVFREPWEAQAFALTISLHEQGLFTWDEWAARLSETIASAQAAGDPDLGDTYYHHWTKALESLVAEKGSVTGDDITNRAEDWRNAYANTPHGQPVKLSPGER